jgi:hypothetical protein
MRLWGWRGVCATATSASTGHFSVNRSTKRVGGAGEYGDVHGDRQEYDEHGCELECGRRGGWERYRRDDQRDGNVHGAGGLAKSGNGASYGD